jgi:hypothetical protein
LPSCARRRAGPCHCRHQTRNWKLENRSWKNRNWEIEDRNWEKTGKQKIEDWKFELWKVESGKSKLEKAAVIKPSAGDSPESGI